MMSLSTSYLLNLDPLALTFPSRTPTVVKLSSSNWLHSKCNKSTTSMLVDSFWKPNMAVTSRFWACNVWRWASKWCASRFTLWMMFGRQNSNVNFRLESTATKLLNCRRITRSRKDKISWIGKTSHQYPNRHKSITFSPKNQKISYTEKVPSHQRRIASYLIIWRLLKTAFHCPNNNKSRAVFRRDRNTALFLSKWCKRSLSFTVENRMNWTTNLQPWSSPMMRKGKKMLDSPCPK